MPVITLTSCLCFFPLVVPQLSKRDVKFTMCNLSSQPAVPECHPFPCLRDCACCPGPHWVCLPDLTALCGFDLSLLLHPIRRFVPLPPQCRNTTGLHELCLWYFVGVVSLCYIFLVALLAVVVTTRGWEKLLSSIGGLRFIPAGSITGNTSAWKLTGI